MVSSAHWTVAAGVSYRRAAKRNASNPFVAAMKLQEEAEDIHSVTKTDCEVENQNKMCSEKGKRSNFIQTLSVWS